MPSLPARNIIGVNNRDLHTFDVALDTSLRLGRQNVRMASCRVAESGIRTSEDMRRFRLPASALFSWASTS